MRIVLVFTVFCCFVCTYFYCFVVLIFIVLCYFHCFVCTSVRLLPQGENPIAVSNINNYVSNGTFLKRKKFGPLRFRYRQISLYRACHSPTSDIPHATAHRETLSM